MSSMKAQMMRRELRKWRLRTPLAHFESIGTRFRAAGIRIDAYRYSPDASFSDEEIDRGFSMAKALGAEILTTRMSPEIADRVAPFADRHRMMVAFAGKTGPGVSPFFRVQVDIGQLTADNVDPVSYIRERHAQITSVCLADRRKDGEAVAWGQGDTPIREVLQLLEQERWPIRAYVEYQYRGEGSAIEEVRKCLAYAKQALG
jgi:L-ribulose-5-phosphate 3-epimerase UlaE